jgi:surface protein
MSVIGGQNTPTTNGLAYIIDFNNNYISGSSTVTPILYLPTASQFTGSVPNLVNGQVQFTGSSVLRSFQTFPGFSATQGNMTLMFSGESKNSNVLFTQDGTVAVVSTTSSIGYGVPAGNLGRNFPNTGFDHVTLRFSSASVDCFINGIPVSASGIFPTVPSSSTFNDFKIGGNYINAWTGSFSGSLGQLMVYNRVLSDDEIYSNYLIQARRYGLPEIAKPYTVDSSVYVYTLAAGITGSSTISALNTFVSGLKTTGLWDKMIAIYPFIGTSPSASRLNLKDVSLNTTQVNYSGSWSTSLSGSYNNNTASYGILSNITPSYVHPLINSQSIHLSYLSYDTPVSGGYLMGVEQIPGLPGDIAAPAAAYSVRKVRTAYTGSALRVRRDSDDLSFDVGFDISGNLDTGSLLTRMTASLNSPALPGDYSGLAAAYSLRRVSSSYSGYAIEVRRAADNYSASIGFDGSGNLNTGSLASFIRTGSEVPAGAYSGLAAAYSLRKVVPGYAGDAIEVQSGSVSQSIGFDSFGDLNIAAIRTFAGSGDAFIKTWYDQSGNNNHATQSLAASQPKIYSGSQGSTVTSNGKPAVEFLNDSLNAVDSPTLDISGSVSIFAVINTTDQTGAIVGKNSNIFGNNSTKAYGIGLFENILYSQFSSGTSTISTTIPGAGITNGLPHLVSSIYTSASISNNLVAYLDSTLADSETVTPIAIQNLSDPLNIGNQAGYAFDGKIQEILLFGSSQAANRTYIENNINSYYGIYTPTSVSTENAFVKTWYDQSGNNRHASQSVDASQPQIVSSGVIVTENGKPTIKSDGIDDSLSPTLPDDFFGTKTIYTFVVNRNNSAANSGNIFAKRNSSVDGNFNISVQNGKYFLQANDAASPNPTIETTNTYNTQQLFSAARTSNGLSIFTPEAKNATFPVADVTSTGVATIFNGSNFGPFFGNLQELIIYTSDQSTNRGLIEDNINGYYNIFTQSLASGSGYVTTWYDQSGNNNHAVQVTASLQPLILSSGSILYTNGKPSPKFDGVDDRLISPVINITQPYTAFTTTLALGVDGTIYDGSYQTTSRSFIRNKQSGGDQIWATNFVTSPNVGGSIQKIIYGLFNGSNSQIATNNSSITTGNVGTYGLGTIHIGGIEFTPMNGYIQEISIYSGNQSSNRAPIEQNTNTYFNVYTPPGYNQNSNSLSLFSSPTVVAGAANASPTGLTTGGPEGLITVSRTGSGDYTLWKNRVPTKTSLPASVPQSQSIYLNAANVSNAIFSGSQNTVAYASVGAGLTDSEVYTYYELVDNLQTNLGRSKSTNPNAFITTWDTRISGTGTVTGTSSIALPLFGTQAITASWGDGTVSLISQSTQVDRTHSYAVPGIYNVSITGQGQGFQFNNGGDRNKLMDVGQWGSISGSTSDGFYGCSNLVGTAADPHILQTTNLAQYFRDNNRFNGYVGNWNTSNVTSLNLTFYNAPQFNQNVGSWDVNKVTNFASTFHVTSVGSFNNGNSDSIKNWNINTSSAVNMSAMFAGATFSQPIGSWNTSAVNNMSSMFQNSTFNQNIGTWDVSNVTTMNFMFYWFGANSKFNNGGSTSINNWRPVSCRDFGSMFATNINFNQPIGGWELGTGSQIPSTGIDMSSMLSGATIFNQNLGGWNVTRVTNMAGLLGGATAFNNSGSSDINNWRPISCSNFSSMFSSATAFNQPVGNWTIGTGSQIPLTGINMSSMFNNADAFNQNIGAWNVEKVTNMNGMFANTLLFNNSGSSDINNWRPISCSNFSSMFSNAFGFNQPVGNWPLSSSTTMQAMFEGAVLFNQNIGTWDVSRISGDGMVNMFRSAGAFNNGGSPSIDSWDVSNITSTSRMFNFAGAFNQPIGSWNVSNVSNMFEMFYFAGSFDQDIGNWNVGKVTNFSNFMAGKTTYSFLHTIYDGWINNKLQPQRTITFNTIKYSGSAAQGRALLTRTYNTASIIGSNDDTGQIAITCSANHNVIAGNKIFISGSSYAGINGVQIVFATGSATTLTIQGVPYDPAATNGLVITGYGWSITDGGVV